MHYDIYVRYSRPYMDATRGSFSLHFAAPSGAQRGECSCGLQHEGAVLVGARWECYDYVLKKGVTKEELRGLTLREWI